MTRHRSFLVLLMALVGFLAMQLVVSRYTIQTQTQKQSAELTGLVKRLQLTDFALWSEARYARHPSQADWFTPHQDFPGSLEHFPAGSLIAPAPVHPATRIEVRHQAENGAG